MKIIPLFQSEENLIKKAIKGDPAAERHLFDRFAPRMLSVCRQYISDVHYAEDVMLSAFARIFENLAKYRFEGSFEGWIRRIMVREAIDFLRSRRKIHFTEIGQADSYRIDIPESHMDLEAIQMGIDALPDGYKTVLVMYAVDGFSHREIAEMLGVSESTSKSQLFKARRQLQELLEKGSQKKNAR